MPSGRAQVGKDASSLRSLVGLLLLGGLDVVAGLDDVVAAARLQELCPELLSDVLADLAPIGVFDGFVLSGRRTQRAQLKERKYRLFL